MKFALLAIIALFATLSQAQAQEKPLLLITSFDGFAGATVNNSNLVSAHLAKLLQNKYEVSECLLPTIYDEGFHHAQGCLNRLPRKPNVIVSLGEGSPCNSIKLETITRNLDDSFGADNAGRTRRQNVIIPHEADSKTFVFFNEQTPGLVSKIKEIQFSTHMGDFVCNNLGFNMTTYLENYSAPRIPFTFMHVPSHECEKGLSVRQSAQAISKLLLGLQVN